MGPNRIMRALAALAIAASGLFLAWSLGAPMIGALIAMLAGAGAAALAGTSSDGHRPPWNGRMKPPTCRFFPMRWISSNRSIRRC